ncbi:Rv2175c family DNA-binding protein [Corynebacterium pyruviciproducens]|uniref:Excisionase family DNA binding domain-containing protein n=2 Tax=Corynebacterium pyruviciproducens TaxID=598660 RepID=S3A0F4_9CORY|nr:Rv2175c family DNA-binding protein [Corynebacterium pyruviciproducens]EPD69829.1 excisionase family DNA binding domain-containing protein [Corynebacterium pyruviciproducens ATCC BAA-1742]MDK6565334.1 Rv2175c family DNA-binding protein [Corynebacterium pyruviciproducens]WOT02954.1 Rv2175c family DNA-binding protein [Corynebacterium pyruviciproducens]
MSVSSVPVSENVLPEGEPLYTLDEVAEFLRVPFSRVKQLLKEHKMIAVKDGKKLCIPARFFNGDHTLNKHVTGAITVLADGGYNDEEILRYFFTEDETLPGRPVDAFHGHLAREVLRRAQAMAF